MLLAKRTVASGQRSIPPPGLKPRGFLEPFGDMANIVVVIGLALVLAGVTIVSRPAGLALALVMAIVGGACLASVAGGAPEERGP